MTARTEPLRVGLIGAGAVVQSIHLPTLARLPELLRVVHVADPEPARAEAIAQRFGARASSAAGELLADPQIDVVAVCSPASLHAEHVIAAAEAGVRAILCEKPLASDPEGARAIAGAVGRAGVPLVVGAMHLHDPGWQQLLPVLEQTGFRADAVDLSIRIPQNAVFEQLAAQSGVVGEPGRMDVADPEAVRGYLRGAVMGLFVHDLPLIRRLVPTVARVAEAVALDPQGIVVGYMSREGQSVRLAQTPVAPVAPRWTLEAWSPTQRVRVDFTPSYVHAGSARARMWRDGGLVWESRPSASNGYEAEWRAVVAAAHGDTVGLPVLDELVQDLEYALAVAAGAQELA
jgi:myo-inositol 2-dehydrogenase / D-chiro-inositol 1-dehydrogenase